MSPYLWREEKLSRAAHAIGWIKDLTDSKLVRREMAAAGFDEAEIDELIVDATFYALQKRKLFSGLNQVVDSAATATAAKEGADEQPPE